MSVEGKSASICLRAHYYHRIGGKEERPNVERMRIVVWQRPDTEKGVKEATNGIQVEAPAA
jgi:hypothetical protein